MNQVVLIGRLARDAEIRETHTGKKLTRFTLCTQDKKPDGRTYFHNIAHFGDKGLFITPLLKKGVEAMVVGKSCPDSYIDKAGHKKYTHTIIAYEVRVFQNLYKEKEVMPEALIKEFSNSDFPDFDIPSNNQTEFEDF